MPVLILTARGDWAEKVEGINAGADDYMAKPLAIGELIARARALVRRAAGPSSPLLVAGELTIDTTRTEERRVGKECVSKCKNRGAPDPENKQDSKKQKYHTMIIQHKQL